MQRANDNPNQSLEEIKRTTALLSQRVNQLERLLDQKSINEAKIEGGTVYQRESRMTLSNGMVRPSWQSTSVTGRSATGMYYSDFAFGFSISGAVDTVNAGKVRRGTRTPVSVAGGDITIGTDQTWVFIAHTYGSTGTLSSSTSEPVDTETVHNHVLHLVTLTDGVASVESGDIKHLGDIFIPGAFA